MQLTLKYNEHATQALSAAFIRGNTPGIWLQEIHAWQIPLEKLVCFIIAQNNNPANAAGLFVIFSKGQMPGVLQVMHPYTMLGGKLFIPVNAELSPAISEPELQSLLIWDYQVFHPTIGFIGFENSDSINLADLLQYAAPRNVYWGYAQAGRQPWIPLHQISVEQLTAQEVFEAFKDRINNKPLTEIPKSNKREVPAWLNNPIAGGLFKGIFTIISGLSSIIPAGLFGSNSSSGGGNSGREEGKSPGLFRKIMNWMEEKIEDLERKRDSELKRLMEMFDKDTNEALQYAIPLSSPYLSRGKAQPSANLTKRSTLFNLGRLGGGYAVDGWNVDNYYSELRAKYLKAAQQAIEENDFKKAAYIYAQLLGDYNAAAATLRQGKYYREAAVLYKEHVKNLTMAATCYEEGGLLTEAIEIYTGLNQHEKAGDLYRDLGQEEPALNCYERCVVAAAANKDYLEESRIIIDKIGNKPRAKKVLLSGWNDVKQPEACLVKYFDLAADDNKEQIHSVVKTFYTNNQVVNKEMAFLNVIDSVNKKYKTAELENTCQNIAYEIVSEQVTAGNPASVHALKNFVTGDQLLKPDCYRFLHAIKDAPKQKPAPDQWQLMNDVHWKKTLTWNNQLLVWGVKPSGLVLARMNWDGYIEHFNWYVKLSLDSPILALADPEHTNYISVYASDGLLTEKLLPRNKHFQDELIVSRLDFMGIRMIGICMHQGEIFALDRRQELGDIYLYRYSVREEELDRIDCTSDGAAASIPPALTTEMFWCNKHFYIACDRLVLRISEEGEVDKLYHAQAPVQKIAVNQRHDGLVTVAMTLADRVLILTTNAGSEYSDEPNEIRGIEVVNMTFLPGDRIVLACKQEIQVYNLWADTDLDLQWQTETENEVIAVFPGPNRDQLGVLESTGKITLHNIKESE
jgi:tetratricopeptide (TPR) repeat protein